MNNNFDITLSKPRDIMSTIEFKYKNYDILKNSNNDYMIVGTENCTDKFNIREAGKKVEFSNSNIFLDMIYLAVKLHLKTGKRTFMQNQFTEQHFLIILDFCKKYGLPYHGNIQENALQYNNYDNTDIFSIETLTQLKEKYGYSTMCYAYCNVSYFIYWLYIMYRDFLWYISIYSKDMVYNVINYLKVDMSYYIKHCDSVAEYFSPVIVNQFVFSSSLFRNGKSFSFEIKTNNIFHLSAYYFSLICIGNNSVDISKTMLVKQCKCCGSYFLTSQSRKKYCEYCSPQKAWNKRNR